MTSEARPSGPNEVRPSGLEAEPYGLIAHLVAQPGQRAALAAILLEGSGEMPGCRSYVVAEDSANPDGLWVTEVWRDRASHQASLELPQVRDAIARGGPLIVEFDAFHETRPLARPGTPEGGDR